MTVLFLNPEGSRRFRSSPLAVSRTWMVDKENLGDNNMSSEQVKRSHRRRSFQGLSHTVFVNSVLFKAKKKQQEKTCLHSKCHSIAHIQKKKKKKKSPALSKCSWLPLSLPDVAKTTPFLWLKSPVRRSSSRQPPNYITLYMLRAVMVFIRDGKGEEKVGGLRSFI